MQNLRLPTSVPRLGRDTIVDLTCVAPYTSLRRLNHTPDGDPLKAARIAEAGKESVYAPLDRSSLEFVPIAFDVFGGVAPKAEHFINQLASLAVSYYSLTVQYSIITSTRSSTKKTKFYSRPTLFKEAGYRGQ